MASINRTRRMHGLPARDLFDKFALIAAAIGGIVGGVVLKRMDVSPLLPAAFSAAVLLAYVLATWIVGRLRIEPEAIGDNCYYLGFIFTLASLAYTLHGLSASPENLTLVAEIVSGFGIALSSTIVGVILRIFLLQFRPDMVAKDRETRIALSDATRDFRTALGQSTTDLKQFAVEIEQKLAEHHAMMERESAKALAVHREAVEAEARRSTEALHKTTIDAITRALGAVEEMTTRISQQSETTIRESAERTRATLEEFAGNLTKTLAQLTDQMVQLADGGLAAGKTLQDGLRDVRNSTDRFRRAMERLSADVESASPAIEGSAKRAAEAMETASIAYAGQLEKVAERLSSNHMDAVFQAHNARLSNLAQKIESASTKLDDALQEHDARLATITQQMELSALAARDAVGATTEAGELADRALQAIDGAVEKIDALQTSMQAAFVPKVGSSAPMVEPSAPGSTATLPITPAIADASPPFRGPGNEERHSGITKAKESAQGPETRHRGFLSFFGRRR